MYVNNFIHIFSATMQIKVKQREYWDETQNLKQIPKKLNIESKFKGKKEYNPLPKKSLLCTHG